MAVEARVKLRDGSVASCSVRANGSRKEPEGGTSRGGVPGRGRHLEAVSSVVPLSLLTPDLFRPPS